jgi:hypothetical protein
VRFGERRADEARIVWAFLDYAAIAIEADIVEGRRIAWYVSGLA